MISRVNRVLKDPGRALTYVDRRFGRDVLDGSTHLSSSVAGSLAIRRAQLLSDSSPRYTSHAAAEKLKRTGIAEVGQLYDDELVERIATRFDEIIEDEYTYTSGTGEKDYRFGIYTGDVNVFELVPEVKELLNESLKEILYAYYGTWFKPVSIRMWRNKHVPPEVVEEHEAFSNYWHVDPHTTDHVKMFMYLSDVTEDHGPFHAVTSQESQQITRNYERSTDGVPNGRVQREADDIFKFTGPAGSVAFCNTNTNLHRAGVPAEGNVRDVVQFMFAPMSEPLPDDWHEDPWGTFEDVENTKGLVKRLSAY